MAEEKKRPATDAEVAAEILANKAQAERDKAEARKFNAEAHKAEIEVAKLSRAEKAELAKDHYYKIYVFDKPVVSSSVDACIQTLAQWSRTDPACDIEIIFNSPGGSVVDGMALFDYIDRVRANGHRITTSSMGIAASMAGILLQAGDVRKMGKQAWLLIHQAQFGAIGSYGEVEDTVKWVKMVQDRILDIFAAKSKISKAQIARKWHRTDWWISADEALKLGFIDAIG